jgi:metallophosphoesterase (TIGR00282 family)
MIKILFIGDIVGKIGRKAVVAILPKLKKELKPDLIIANAENIAHGSGVSAKTLKEVMDAGVDYFTCGDHAFKREKELGIYDTLPIIRPANYAKDAPGKGYAIIKAGKDNILLINLIGRVFMDLDHDCPFHKLDEILAENLADKNLSAIIIDMHAEATSEKVAMGHYADGRVSAITGTHTHIMTADHKITKKGTAYITDAGMAGFADGCIGINKEGIIKTFLTQIKNKHTIPEVGKAMLNAVLFEIDTKTGEAKSIKPIIKFVEIK